MKVVITDPDVLISNLGCILVCAPDDCWMRYIWRYLCWLRSMLLSHLRPIQRIFHCISLHATIHFDKKDTCVEYIGVVVHDTDLGHLWFEWWFATQSVPGHYLGQRWHVGSLDLTAVIIDTLNSDKAGYVLQTSSSNVPDNMIVSLFYLM